MTDLTDRDTARFATLAWALLGATVMLVLVLMLLPASVSLGAFYWDSFLYLDASNRIASGQIPNVDFAAPVGPLGYYLTHWVLTLFPNAQPALAASWSITLVTVPLFALVLWDVAKRQPVTAFALAAGFAIFTTIPLNTDGLYPFPGFDGFGIYNRHGAQLLFVLTAALIYVKRPVLLAAITGLVMAAMFSVKITAFGAAGIVCLFALITGHIPILAALGSVAIFAALLGSAELATGVVSAYVADIIALVQINQGGLPARLVQAVSRGAGTLMAGAAFALALLVLVPRDRLFRTGGEAHPAWWMGAAALAGIIFESENTGSQEFILLFAVIPYAVSFIREATGTVSRATLYLLAGATALPLAVNHLHEGARTVASMIRQTPLQNENLGRMGHVTVRPDQLERAEAMRAHSLKFPEADYDLAERNQVPEYLLYSSHAFQAGLMQDMDAVTGRLKQLQADGLDYATITTLDFANPFPWLLGKQAPMHVQIGAVPGRTLSGLDPDAARSISETDIVLEPACPFDDQTEELRTLYAPALEGHVKVKVTDCYAAWVVPRLAPYF